MEQVSELSAQEAWRARLFHERDRASLLRLSASHYGEKEHAKEEYFDWLAGGGPAGPALVTVAEELASGEIVGFAFHVPFEVNFVGALEKCYLGCNLLVHPHYRGQGIYSAFNELFRGGGMDSLFSFGFPKPRAMLPHHKVGKFPVTRIPLLVRPLDIARLTAERVDNAAFRLVINVGWRVAGRTILRPRIVRPGTNRPQISSMTSFDESFNRFWDRVRDKYQIIVNRDQAFLTWRFGDLSFRSYEILAAQSSGELVGYVVLRFTEMQGVQAGLIMDLLVEPGARGEQAGLQLVEAATHRFQEAQMALAACLMLRHTQEHRILRRAGYVETPDRFSPQAFYLNTTSLSSRAPNEFLSRPDRWFVTMANHDAI